MKFYVTKYALTAGIQLVEGELCEPTSPGGNPFIKYKQDGWASYAHRNDFYADLASAKRRAEVMRQNKVASLQKNLKKMQNLEIKVVDCP